MTLLAGATAGIVNPVNPLLAPEHIAAILRDTRAKVVVTLAPFPKTDLAQKVAEAVALAPGRRDRAAGGPDPLPRAAARLDRAADPAEGAGRRTGRACSTSRRAMARERGDGARLRRDARRPRLRLFPHRRHHRACRRSRSTGRAASSTTAGAGSYYMFTEADVLMCPLPMFHVFAAYPILMSCLMSGAQVVMPTPQGYRGEGVMDNFWKLVERHKVTFLITVPTAAAALMQRQVDADVSTLQLAISGSAAMPVELFHRFEAATGVKMMEGYGMTEATCLVAINPPYGERKIGSVGLPFPYTDVAILHCDAAGAVPQECGTDEVGEICVRNPGRSARRSTPTAAQPGRDRRGRLPAHRRPRADRRGRLPLDHRPGEGPDHPGRAQHRPGDDRGGADGASGGGLRRGDRPARRAFGRAAGGLCRAGRGRHGDGVEALLAHARARTSRAGGGAEARRGPRRAAEDRGRQGLQARPAAAGDRPGLRRGAGRGRVGRRGWRRWSRTSGSGSSPSSRRGRAGGTMRSGRCSGSSPCRGGGARAPVDGVETWRDFDHVFRALGDMERIRNAYGIHM